MFKDQNKEVVVLPQGLIPKSEKLIDEDHCNRYREYYDHLVPLVEGGDYPKFDNDCFQKMLNDLRNDIRVIGKDVLADEIIGSFRTCGILEATGQEAPSSIDECLDLLRSNRMKAYAKTSPLSPLRFVFFAVYWVTESHDFNRRLE